MKPASIAFIIVSFVATTLTLMGLAVYFLQLNAVATVYGRDIIGICCAAAGGAVVDTTIGIVALVKLLRVRERKQLKVIAILTLIFCSLLAGIFMLLIKDEELRGEESDEKTSQVG